MAAGLATGWMGIQSLEDTGQRKFHLPLERGPTLGAGGQEDTKDWAELLSGLRVLNIFGGSLVQSSLR